MQIKSDVFGGQQDGSTGKGPTVNPDNPDYLSLIFRIHVVEKTDGEGHHIHQRKNPKDIAVLNIYAPSARALKKEKPSYSLNHIEPHPLTGDFSAFSHQQTGHPVTN